jgi:ParB family chromosome partitioning protein
MSHIKRLGMGLDALIGGTEAEPTNLLETALLQPNPFQPRADFDEDEIKLLAESLRREGMLQPVVVRPAGGSYQIVAGERRWRAARLAGLDRIPVVVRELDDRKALEIALVENLQRRDLNPMEKARGFRQLMQMNGWTQEELADTVGLSRPSVANFMRLLELPPEVQEAVSRGTITMGHARALLSVSQRGTQFQMLKRIIQEELSVRELEKLLTRRPAAVPVARSKDAYVLELEQKLRDRLGVKVDIQPGALMIRYSSDAELGAVLRRLGVA